MVHWYTNNLEEHKFEEGKQPYGFVRGRLQSVIEKQKTTELSKPKEKRKIEYEKRSKTNRDAHHKRTEESKQKMREAKIGFVPWIKGLNKTSDNRVMRLSESSRLGMLKYVETKKKEDPDFYNRWRSNIRKKMHENGTSKSSSPEDKMYEDLCNEYGQDDVERHYSDDRYPFECDFHIKSTDHFIELNYHPSHGEHPYDFDSEEDASLLKFLSEDNSKWSRMIIDVWANRDVKKLQCAKKNKLFYTVIYRNYSFSLQ